MVSYAKFLRLFVAAILMIDSVSAQRYLGIATSDWSAIYSLYLNPASIADCREKVSINILSMNVGMDNNLGPIPKIPDVGNTISNSDNIFTKSQKKNFSMLAPAAVLRGPGVMITLSKKFSVALTTGIRAINQFNNFDPALYKVFTEVSSLPTNGYTAKARNFNWTAHMWSEVGLTLGGVVSTGFRHRLNMGVTVRRLGGIGYVGIIGKNLDIDYQPSANVFSATNSDIAFSSNVPSDSSQVFKHITPSGLLDKFFGQTAGNGISTDIGVTYRYRFGDPEPSDYQESDLTHDIILSASVTDWGAVRYYDNTNAKVNITGSGELLGQDRKIDPDNVANMISYAKSHGFNVDASPGARKLYLPAALLASCDVQVHGRFFVNLLYIANIANRQVLGNSYYNQVTLTPRYDYHKMTIALPLTYSMLAHDIKAGFAVRYRGLFIGSDDFLAILSRKQRGFGAYIGAYFPIFKISHDPIGLHWRS